MEGNEMIFKLETAGDFYPQKDRREKLEKLGFKFVPDNWKGFRKDESVVPTIEINTLDELLAFAREYNQIIIDGEGTILIYDDYIE